MNQVDPKLRALLQNYLEGVEQEKHDGITLKALHGKVDGLWRVYETLSTTQAQQAVDVAAAKRRMDRHGAAIEALKRGASALEQDEDTGRHQLEDYRLAQLEEDRRRARESGIWWKRSRWLAIGAVALALFTAGVGGCVGYAVHRLEMVK